MSSPRRQKHVTALEVFATITDERLAEMIEAIDKAAKDSQSSLHALRMEQRRRRRAKDRYG
jgi:hypothetical protein